jgi:hypothetical protein
MKKNSALEIALGMEAALLSSASLFRVAVDAESIRERVVDAIRTALNNKGFFRQIIAAAKGYPSIYAVRLNLMVKSSAMGGKTTAATATMYDDPNNPVAQQTMAGIAKSIEDYLNQYDELYPTKLGGDTVSYNNFAFNIDVEIPKDQNV